MRAHIVGTSTSNYDTKKTDADEKQRIKNNLSQLTWTVDNATKALDAWNNRFDAEEKK